jgi:hypothetical protein
MEEETATPVAERPEGSRKNNFTFSHPVFGSSFAAPQSQNPRNSAIIPVVLLNRRNQIQPKSGRQFCESIFARTLSGLG